MTQTMTQTAEVNLLSHPLTGVSLIEASAGTGKTYTITHLYLRCLLETDATVQQILLVTFTNAATQELKGRIRDLLAAAWEYLHDHSMLNPQLESMLDRYREDDQARLKLQRALINFDEAAIYSIHGFCQRILNSFPVETQSLLQQQIIADEKQLQQAAIRDYWRKQIVDCEMSRLRWILSNWADPDSLLNDIAPLLEYAQHLKQKSPAKHTDQQQAALADLWNQLGADWLTAQTDIGAMLLQSKAFNRATLRVNTVTPLLSEFSEQIQQPLPYALAGRWELLGATKLSACLKKGQTDERLNLAFFSNTENFAEQHTAWLKNLKLSLLLDAAVQVQNQIKEVKKAAQNISFNDLITQLSAVLTPQNSGLIDKITSLYPIAMVDEFQDTDQQQYHIFSTLYQSKPDKTLILIGDPKQAIYSFRGADVFTYQQARQATSSQFTLSTNYRSTPDYIELVNSLFSQQQNSFIYDQLIDFFPSNPSTENVKSLTQNAQPAAAFINWIHPCTPVPLSKAEASDYFASICADEIAQILQQKTLLLDGKVVAAEDLAILVRTGKQASLMKARLAERGISSALLLRDSVFSSEQAAEISLLLEVLINPANVSRLFGLLSTDLYGWNAKQIYQLQINNQPLIELLEQIRIYQQQWQEKGILAMFFQLLTDQQTVQKNMLQMEGERRITNWLHIMELLQQQSVQHASLGQSLQWLVQQREQAEKNPGDEQQLRLDSDSNLVRIVTIHKSKGLQYPIVFLPFMWDVMGSRYQPKSYSVHDEQGQRRLLILDESERKRWHQENLGEAIRLFYVAMTRAVYRCYLGWGHIKGAGSSAIAHCLFPDNIKSGPFPCNLDVTTTAQLRRPFETLAQQTQSVEIIESEVLPGVPLQRKKPSSETPVAKTFSRSIRQQWHISSYSQLASAGFSHNSEQPDYDALQSSPSQSEMLIPIKDSKQLSRFNFQKGARAGNFLHDILEHQPFHQPVSVPLIQQKCLEYGFDEIWLPCLSDWIKDILQCPLKGLPLNQLQPAHKLSEMEFYMSSKNLQADALNQLLHRYQYSLPEQIFSFRSINGFLKGFIDLVFEANGQYFVADYKSNYLGPTLQDYNVESCKAAMYDHHYHLQYLIYSLALHRYLQQRRADYDYEQHFGGVYYLFLRGMSAGSDNHEGIYFERPALQVIEQLDALFSGDES